VELRARYLTTCSVFSVMNYIFVRNINEARVTGVVHASRHNTVLCVRVAGPDHSGGAGQNTPPLLGTEFPSTVLTELPLITHSSHRICVVGKACNTAMCVRVR
jgi:hypothetical protein